MDLSYFANALARRLRVDPQATYQLLSMWQPFEGGDATNPLNTTEAMPGAWDWNDIGVKRYASVDDGVEATARTLENGRYPNILAALRSGTIDPVAIAPDVRTWTSGSPTGQSNFADHLLGGGGGAGGRAPTAEGVSMTNPPNDVPGTPADYGAAADQLDDVLREILAAKPDPDSPEFRLKDGTLDSVYYQKALSDWSTAYTNVAKNLKALREASLGIVEMPDGSIVATGTLTPEQRAAVDRANYNNYAAILNKFGLDRYNLLSGATDKANATRNADFQNRLSGYEAGMAYDKLNLSKAAQDLDRWLKGQDIASADAGRIQAAREYALKYGTVNGKTDFTPTDLGSGVSRLAAIGGLGADAPIIRYPGTQIWDPVGDRLASLDAMGIANAPPSTPALITLPGGIPAAPALDFSRPPLPDLVAPMIPPPPVVIGGQLYRHPATTGRSSWDNPPD